jgi:pimeloyl-ACP methyl ester carboxylesterase
MGSKSSGSQPSGSATPGSGTTSGTATSTGSLQWGDCTDDTVTEEAVQCATLAVPLDYSAPEGETIDLALIRQPATGAREGAILFNPGGPGASGFDPIAEAGSRIAGELGVDDLDLVGFDPRGVDRSNGIRCLTDAEQDRDAYLDSTPDTPEEQAALDQARTALSTACVAKYGDTLLSYSTANTARDMDAIRVAMGDDTISYLGISYGTYLGAVYATMFPDHVRALVLDSAFEPTGDTIEQQYETQLTGFEHAFDDWATWCEGADDCAFSTADVPAAWDALYTSLDDNPVPNADGRIGNQSVLRGATVAALYSKDEWPVLGDALADAAGGDPAGLFDLADSYNRRDDDGHYETIGQSNTVINCASGLEGQTPQDPAAFLAELQAAAPRFTRGVEVSDFDDEAECLAMMPAQPMDTISYSGSAPIVVVGGTNDPATPFRWAEEMTAALGASASLVTYTGEGHGQLLASACVTAIEAALLADLKSPADDTTCDPDPEIARPVWWDSLPAPAGIDPVLKSSALTSALGLSPTQFYGEIHTSDLDTTDVLAAYKPALIVAGFTYAGDQQPLVGSEQAVYNSPNGDFFSVLALGTAAFAEPDLKSAAPLVPEGKTVVVLLYLPN